MTNAAHVSKIMWNMAKGAITKIGFMKKHSFEKREVSLSAEKW